MQSFPPVSCWSLPAKQFFSSLLLFVYAIFLVFKVCFNFLTTNQLTYRHWIFTSTIADYTSYVSYLHKLSFVQKKWDPQWGSLCYPSCSSSFSFFCYCWSSILPARNPSFCWRCLRLPLPSSSSGVIKYYYKCWNDRHEN